jgi:uncharacterized protein YndB with AHSA1/START domain
VNGGDAERSRNVVEVSVHIAARPETVFAYFTDPVRYTQWMGGDATLVAVPGGAYRIRMRGGVEAAGVFLEIDPPRRVVFTWGWTGGHPVPPGTTRVIVTLAEEDGGTRVVLRHHGLPTDEQRGQHRTGWELYLDRLRVRVAGGDPGPDPNG